MIQLPWLAITLAPFLVTWLIIIWLFERRMDRMERK